MKKKILRCHSTAREPVRLDFFPCRNTGADMRWEDWHLPDREALTVYQTDYTKLLLPYLQQAFPCINPANDKEQGRFDVCFDNWIGADAWQHIIESIQDAAASLHDVAEQDFHRQFTNWVRRQLTWADLIVVEGSQ